jgi:dCTP deaminase
MGILTSSEISKQVVLGGIDIKPFTKENVQINSYDVTLNNTLITYLGTVLDMKMPNQTQELIIPEEGLVLEPGKLYLGSTNEAIGSSLYVPMLEGRSSLGRLGISIHATAGVGDLGFKNRWTLEISVVQPVKIYPNVRVGQVIFFKPEGDTRNQYTGKYANSVSVEASRSHEDFNS